MNKQIFKLAALFLLTSFTFSSCKKERTCTCTLTYFNGTSQTRIVSVGKATLKKGQNKCNSTTSDIVAEETKNGLNSAKCEIQ